MPEPAHARWPFILVLAGVNGAGKSSVGGAMLAEHGLTWFNPDSFARELVQSLRLGANDANGRAWQHGRSQLDAAIANGTNYAFETTLGAKTIPALLAQAAITHDVLMLFCGLQSPELHIQRVRSRVASGGHDIPESKIRERWVTSRINLIRLMPDLARLQVFDNSAEAAAGQDIPQPLLVLEMVRGRIAFPTPDDPQALDTTPEWARPIVQAAIEHETQQRFTDLLQVFQGSLQRNQRWTCYGFTDTLQPADADRSSDQPGCQAAREVVLLRSVI